MAEYDVPRTRIENMIQGASVGLNSYKSPYAYVDGHDDGNQDEEMDLGQAGDHFANSHFMRPSFEADDDSSQAILPPLRKPSTDAPGPPRESKFKEIFRTLSTSVKRNAVSLSQHGRIGSVMSSIEEHTSPQSRVGMEEFRKKFAHVPEDCHAREDTKAPRRSFLYIFHAVIGLLAAIGSGYAFCRAIIYKEWEPSTITHLDWWNSGYKAVEILFAAVYVSFLGQVLSRRAYSKESEKALNIAELTMRNWVIQPGSLISHGGGIPHAGISKLGVLTIVASISTMFYTSVCNSIITPYVSWSEWKENVYLSGHVRTTYGNLEFIKSTCPAIESAAADTEYSASCVIMRANGESYRTLLAYLADWQHGTYSGSNGTVRPGARAIIMENTTLSSAWIGDSPLVAETNGRLTNNVTLAMPHAGLSVLFSESQNKSSIISQPGELDDAGGWDVLASVVSPAINVLCVNAKNPEVQPLVRGKNESSPLDDLFQWGEEYNNRWRPSFETLAPDHQFVSDTRDIVHGADSIYFMGKSSETTDYTVCQLRSMVVTTCATRFQASRYSANMSAICGADTVTPEFQSYKEVSGDYQDYHLTPSWRDLAVQWNLALGLNNGAINASSANVRLLSGLILTRPELSANLPSFAEALAVFASPTLIDSSLGATFSHSWDHGNETEFLPAPGFPESIVANYRAVAHISGLRRITDMTLGKGFSLAVLLTVFLISGLCVLWHLCRMGFIADYTEPQNMFALAINSPASRKLKGACGRGPNRAELGVAFRIAYAEEPNHFFFEDAEDAPLRAAAKRLSKLTSSPNGSQVNLLPGGTYAKSYKRLSAKVPLL